MIAFRKAMRFMFILLLTLLPLELPLVAQTSQGRILGTVFDSSGAVIPQVRVTVTNTATGVNHIVVTTSSGDYTVPNLNPGTYTVSAAAQGFKKSLSSSFLLEVSREVRIDLKLQPGTVTETVEVTAEAAMVDTTDTALNGVLSNTAVVELPVQGRDFQNLLELHPGVQRTPGGGLHSVTSNGNRPDDNNYFIDGADDNDPYYGETVVNDAGITGTPASFLPLDAIQEFNTQESPSADNSVKPGLVANIGIKSGSNNIHGSAYYFHRNAAFDARNYYDQSPNPVSALLMHEFGGSLGGPIKKDRWFYFVSYEGIRDKVGNPSLTDSPVTVSLAGKMGGIANSDGSPNSASYSVPDAIAYFSDPNNVAYCLANTSSTTCTVNPLSVKLTGLFLPNPGFTLVQSDPAGINFDFNNKNRGDNMVARTDYILSSHNILSARLIYGNADQTEEDTIPLRPEWLSTTSPTTVVSGVSLASTFGSAWSNDLRFSYNRFNESIFSVDHNVDPMTYGLNTGVTNPVLFGFPRINPGTDAFDYMGGNSSYPLETKPSEAFSFSDTAIYTLGEHSIRFGGSYHDGKVNYYRAGNGRGRVEFSDLTDFIDGNVHRWRFLYGNPARNVSLKAFGLFAQDDFRIRPNVTLNLGVRYDVTEPVKDTHDLLANYVPTSTSGIVQVGQGLSSPYPTNHNNVSPRVGVAWDIFGNGKTVLRSAYGMIFEQPAIRTFMFNGGGLNLNPSGIPYVDASGALVQPAGTITAFLVESNDGSQITWDSAGPIFPQNDNSQCSLGNQCAVFGVDLKLKTPYVMNWNFNVQQKFTESTVLQIAYVGNHGVKLYSVTDINQVNPANDDGSETVGRPLNTNCPINEGGLGTGGPCFPFIGFLDYLSNRSGSIYHSLQVTLTKNYSRGLYLLAGYTWAHAIDTATSNLAGVPPDSNNYNEERGNGDYDIRHRFTLSMTYELKPLKAKWQMLKGWQVTSIVNAQANMPYTLGDYGDDISGTGEYNDRWNMIGPESSAHWSATKTIPYFSFTTDPSTGVVLGNQQCINAVGGSAPSNAGAEQLLNYGCYVSGNLVITPPLAGTQGNMHRNGFRGPRFVNWDFSLSKSWKLNERLKVQFRGEAFNIMNHTNFTDVGTDLSSPGTVGLVSFTPDVAASNPVIGSGGSRHIQVGAKIIW